ncbi:SDR family NAD(P)-dependent oxidoreductase [Thiotrichales bacterium 19S9-12]|nr:SDR family NAD(P)-dependent oxidoreductase [Thiotrichales bacterium 19S9-11]MCF6811852.1 SDR family NAD(P)-dependent oxidoreductase [Thiotrichales bacterium 19S9-12]
MESLKNKIVLITGASSGIGEACAHHFAKEGANLILTARRIDRLKELKANLENQHGIQVLPLQLDVQNKTAVREIIQAIPSNWQDIDIVVNNAGLALTTDKIQDGNPDDWDVMINTNVKGLLYVTRATLDNMVRRKSGHVINISSIAGLGAYSGGNVYCATKHAVQAISDVLRIDLLGTNIRVTTVNPGMVHTEFSEVRWEDKDKSDAFYANTKPLSPNDIASSVVFCAQQPLHVTVSDITVVPSIQADTNHIYAEGKTGGSFN